MLRRLGGRRRPSFPAWAGGSPGRTRSASASCWARLPGLVRLMAPRAFGGARARRAPLGRAVRRRLWAWYFAGGTVAYLAAAHAQAPTRPLEPRATSLSEAAGRISPAPSCRIVAATSPRRPPGHDLLLPVGRPARARPPCRPRPPSPPAPPCTGPARARPRGCGRRAVSRRVDADADAPPLRTAAASSAPVALLGLAHGQHPHLLRGQPRGERPGVVLDETAHEALEGPDTSTRCIMTGRCWVLSSPTYSRSKRSGQVEVELDWGPARCGRWRP